MEGKFVQYYVAGKAAGGIRICRQCDDATAVGQVKLQLFIALVVYFKIRFNSLQRVTGGPRMHLHFVHKLA